MAKKLPQQRPSSKQLALPSKLPQQRDNESLRNFKWKTRDEGGKKIAVKDMETDHVFRSFRLLAGSLIPGLHHRAKQDVLRWSKSYVKTAVRAFMIELVRRRDELTGTQLDYLDRVCAAMADNNISRV
jgi:hypothetical protein